MWIRIWELQTSNRGLQSRTVGALQDQWITDLKPLVSNGDESTGKDEAMSFDVEAILDDEEQPRRIHLQ
jgi:hypothetical protein